MKTDRRTMLLGAVSGAFAAAASTALAAPRTAAGPGQNASWYDRAIIIDGLGDAGDPYADDGISRWSDRGWAETMATGVTAVRDSVLPVGNGEDPWSEYQKRIVQKQEMFAANPDRLLLVRSAADILTAKREKKFAVILGTQDTAMVGGGLDRLAQMKRDGVTTVQLTYNNRNLAGDGALEPGDAGISKLGKATIERIEAEKLLLDLSHGGARTMAEATAFAKRPLVISHTGARAVADHPRNTSDETLRAVAAKGGVVGVYFMPFLKLDGHPAGADLIQHIEHVANVAGEDHVGIGTDNGVLPTILDAKGKAEFDNLQRERIAKGIAAPGEAVGVYPFLPDYNSIDRYRRLAADLSRRGWSQARLEKLMGGNFLRVYRDAWGG
jgi:membrane dipeptidase